MLKVILNLFVFINRVRFVYDKTKNSDHYYINKSWKNSLDPVQDNLVAVVNMKFNRLPAVKEIHHYQDNLYKISCKMSKHELQRLFYPREVEAEYKPYLAQQIIRDLTNNIYEFVTFYGNKETGDYTAEILIVPKRN